MLLLSQALAAASPRLSPPPTPINSVLIHGGVIVLWFLLFSATFYLSGVLAWAVGITYISYDTLLLLFVFRQTLPLARVTPKAATPTPDTPRQSLAVLIAAYNEAAVLAKTIQSLDSQTDRPDQIIVADDGSTDDTPGVMARVFGLTPPPLCSFSGPSPTHPTVFWLRLPHGGKARALNAAITQIDTDLVLTVDGDTLLAPGAVAAMRTTFMAEPNLVAATGVLTPVCAQTARGRLLEWFQTFEYIRNFISRYAWMQLNALLLISGAFGGFRRTAIVAVGGFDPECLVEDYELIHRLRRYAVTHNLAWSTGVLGSATARTEAPSTVRAFLRQRRRWFAGFLQTQYWYRDMVGNRQYGWLGTAMLPVKAFDTLQPLYGLTAIFLLFGYLFTGHLHILALAGFVIIGKIVIDLAFHLWSIHLYHRWIGSTGRLPLVSALVASLLEPFSFQVLRHTGAALGWFVFLSGRQRWGKQQRTAFAAAGQTNGSP